MIQKISLMLLLLANLSFAQNLNKDNAEHIQKIIKLFREKNSNEISKIINYPLHRQYPIPPVKNRQDFVRRFDTLFDKTFVDIISKSNVNDWSEVGWRGIMLNQGDMWIDDNGKIIAVNYQSQFEKNQRGKYLLDDKVKLHSSLKTFEEPVYRFKTKNYLIRIDRLKNGKYRYACWKNSQSESSKPDLILSNGNMQFEGSGGNHTVNFKNENYSYSIYRNIIGEKNAPEIKLEIKKNNNIILTEHGILLENN